MARLVTPFVDCHTHSTFSPDSNMSVAEACHTAVQVGLGGMVLTDHYDFVAGSPFMFDFHERAKQIEHARSLAPLSFKLLEGAELDYQPHLPDQIRTHVAAHPYDQIILSVHALERCFFNEPEFWPRYSCPADMFRCYLEEVYNSIAQCDDFDIIGHIGVPQRYVPKPGACMPYCDYREHLDAILALIIKKEKALEVNTSGLHAPLATTNKPLGFLLPDIDVLARYHELGGTLITLGSDAHRTHSVGGSFAETAAILKAIGFQRVAYFRQRQVCWIDL